MNINADNIHFIQGVLPSEDFTLGILQTPVVVGEVSGTTTVDDITYNFRVTAGVINEFMVQSTSLNTVFSSETPSVATVNSVGQVSYVADGTAIIKGYVAGVGSKKATQVIENTTEQTNISVNAYGNGSLRKYLSDQLNAVFNYATANLGGSTAALQRYASGTPSAALFTELAGIAGWTPFDATIENGEDMSNYYWISPHHYIRGIGWAHNMSNYPAYGSNLVWVGIDIVVGYSATAWTGRIVKFLPVGWETYLPVHPESYINPISGVPCFVRFANTYNGSNYWIEPVFCSVSEVAIPTDADLTPYLKTTGGIIATGGDSGSPVFAGINGDLVLLGRVWGYGGTIDWYGNYLTAASRTGGTMSTHDVRTWAADITTAMNNLASYNNDATVYALQYADLSGFTAY